MDEAELREVLEDAGLSPYQTAAYVALLELGAASATEIATTSGVPDPRIYDVLGDLGKKGYVETYEEGTLHARAHSLEDVLEDLRGRASRFSAAADEIEARWERPALPSHEVSVVSRFETVLERARSEIENASNQVRLSVSPEQFRRLAPALEAAFREDVMIYLMIHTDAGKGEPLPEREELRGRCQNVRHRTLPAPFLALVDRSVACFAPHTDSANPYGILVDDRSHAYVFYWYYQTCLWEPWEPIDLGTEEPPTRFVDIRQCIREIEPHLDEDGIEATIEGRDTTTGDTRTLTGTITEVSYRNDTSEQGAVSLAELAGPATLTLETDDRSYSVGGWGAILEGIEATRITLETPLSTGHRHP